MTPIKHSRGSFFQLQPNDKVMLSDLPYVVRQQARGGMGCVYLLEKDTVNAPERISDLGLRLALKGILPEKMNADSIALFRRELTVWAGLRQNNILWLLEIVDGGDAGWVAAMDWCMGSLRDILSNRNTLTLKETTDIMFDMIRGLGYAYNNSKIIHLDLKPENVLYHIDVVRAINTTNEKESPLGSYKFMISDWGIASIKQEELNRITAFTSRHAKKDHTFNNFGTLHYMAPERFRPGEKSSVESDVFSLGMMYFEMLLGALPFREDMDPIGALLSQTYFADAKDALMARNVPGSVRRLVLKMLAFRPEDRFSNHKDLYEEIKAAWLKRNSLISNWLK